MIALVRAGVPLADALEMCIPRERQEVFTKILKSVCDYVKQGLNYSEACLKFPEAFDSIYAASIKTGEETGNLLEVLKQYQAYLMRIQKTEREIKQALYYPVFLFASLVVVMTILFVFVVPSFSELYSSLNAELPVITRVTLAVSQVFPVILVFIAFFVIVSTVLWKSMNKPDGLIVWVDGLVNHIPMIGGIRRDLQKSRVTRMLAGLLSAGTPVVPSLKICASAFSKTQLGISMSRSASLVQSGAALSESLKRQNILQPQLVRMIRTGEESGSLAEMLENVAVFIEEKLDTRLSGLTAIFEPAMMLLLGLMVGVVIISMYLPIFFLSEVVG